MTLNRLKSMVNPIVLIDSGVGGLTIFDAIYKKLPQASYIYCMDNASYPYGNKPGWMIEKSIRHCLETLQKNVVPAAIVIACNTASIQVLPTMHKEFDCLMVGVLPAIQPAVLASKHQCVGLLATPMTVDSDFVNQTIKQYANACPVIKIGNLELVNLAEQKIAGIPPNPKQIKQILTPFLTASVIPDQIVLGCTHFPLLQSELQQAMEPHDITWIEPRERVANQVLRLLAINDINVKSANPSLCAVYTKMINMNTFVLNCLQMRQFQGPYFL